MVASSVNESRIEISVVSTEKPSSTHKNTAKWGYFIKVSKIVNLNLNCRSERLSTATQL